MRLSEYTDYSLRVLMYCAVHRQSLVTVGELADFRLVECFDPQTNACSLSPSCRLRLLFQDGLQAFFAQLDGATLADIVGPLPPPREGASAHRPVIPLVSAPQEP